MLRNTNESWSFETYVRANRTPTLHFFKKIKRYVCGVFVFTEHEDNNPSFAFCVPEAVVL
jgi:hypothetical protein